MNHVQSISYLYIPPEPVQAPAPVIVEPVVPEPTPVEEPKFNNSDPSTVIVGEAETFIPDTSLEEAPPMPTPTKKKSRGVSTNESV